MSLEDRVKKIEDHLFHHREEKETEEKDKETATTDPAGEKKPEEDE
jgi:hypothetical protein